MRLAVTAGCAALLVCLPQPSWAARTSTHPSWTSTIGQAIVRGLPNPFRQQPHH